MLYFNTNVGATLTTIARRPATRTRGRRTEAQESRTAAQDVPVLPLACGPARRPALSRTLPWTTRQALGIEESDGDSDRVENLEPHGMRSSVMSPTYQALNDSL